GGCVLASCWSVSEWGVGARGGVGLADGRFLVLKEEMSEASATIPETRITFIWEPARAQCFCRRMAVTTGRVSRTWEMAMNLFSTTLRWMGRTPNTSMLRRGVSQISRPGIFFICEMAAKIGKRFR